MTVNWGINKTSGIWYIKFYAFSTAYQHTMHSKVIAVTAITAHINIGVHCYTLDKKKGL